MRRVIPMVLVVLALAVPVLGKDAPVTTRPASGPSESANRPESTFTDRAKAVNKAGGVDRKTQAQHLQRAAAIDKAIREHLAKGGVSKEIEEALWAGRPALGMTADQLRMIGRYEVRTETKDYQRAGFIATDFRLYTASETPVWWLTMEGGKVAEIEHP